MTNDTYDEQTAQCLTCHRVYEKRPDGSFVRYVANPGHKVYGSHGYCPQCGERMERDAEHTRTSRLFRRKEPGPNHWYFGAKQGHKGP